MTEHDREKITVDRTNEMRADEIANMISEGGLGADKYYNILKQPPGYDSNQTGHSANHH